MTAKVWYDLAGDVTYLIQWSEHDGRRAVVVGDTIVSVDRGALLPEGTKVMLMSPVEVLDALLDAGYRPSSKAWAAGHVEALERHITFAEKVASTLLEKSTRET